MKMGTSGLLLEIMRKTSNITPSGFTIAEVAAALVLLSLILSSVLVLMNRYAAAVVDLQLHQQAFELARANMERLLSEPKLSDISDYGTSDTNPELEWQTVVEPFYEPVTNQMWIRAVCSAGYMDTKGQYQNVELEHWITNLTAEQVKQILAQQKAEDAYLELLQEGQLTAIQETTRAYLEQMGLDVEAYEKLMAQQRRKKLEYLSRNGFEGYQNFLGQLEEEENAFLEKIGMNFDGYNEFARTYVPRTEASESFSVDLPQEGSETMQDTAKDASDTARPAERSDPSRKPASDGGFNWDNVPPELVPLIEQLLGIKKNG